MKTTTSGHLTGSDYLFILHLTSWALFALFCLVMASFIGISSLETNGALLDPLIEQFSACLSLDGSLTQLELDELFFTPWIAWGQMTVLFILSIPYGALMGVVEGQVDTALKRNKGSAPGCVLPAWYITLGWFVAPLVAAVALVDHRFLVISAPWLAVTGYSLAFTIVYAAASHLTHLAFTNPDHE